MKVPSQEEAAPVPGAACGQQGEGPRPPGPLLQVMSMGMQAVDGNLCAFGPDLQLTRLHW